MIAISNDDITVIENQAYRKAINNKRELNQALLGGGTSSSP
jgi:hypothetical protein